MSQCLTCAEEARPGSMFCEYCRPPPTPAKKQVDIEAAQVRVARAQEERDRLHEEVLRKHGSLADLSLACKPNGIPGFNAQALRTEYNRAVKELRFAKQDLEFERAEAGPSPVMDERTPMQRAAADAEPIVLHDGPRYGFDCEGCVRKGKASERIICRDCEENGDEAGNPTNYEAAPKPAVSEEAYEYTIRRAVQLGLDMEPAKTVETESETVEYHVFLAEHFKVRISEKALEKLSEKKHAEVEIWVQGHMRPRDPKRLIPNGAFDRDAAALYAKIRMVL